ncbi:MAG: hypothetical protein WAK17_28790 [Candidatus Nitrosopolaris sp.]
MLAFFCMLVYVKQELKDKQKLMKSILEISEKYSSNLQGWTDTIDIMSNSQEVKRVKEAEEYYKTKQ